MSVVKNQCGLGFQSDVIDFFFLKFDEYIVHVHVCMFVLGMKKIHYVLLTV